MTLGTRNVMTNETKSSLPRNTKCVKKDLTKPITGDEIELVITKLQTNKSPGPKQLHR